VKTNRTPHVQFRPSAERHTFSSARQPNATRSPYKEVKTKTETETKTPPPTSSLFEESFTSKENARAREAYRQEDFDERDLRKLGDAFKELNRRLEAGMGTGCSFTEKQIFEAACEIAGITIKRGLEVQELGKTVAGRNRGLRMMRCKQRGCMFSPGAIACAIGTGASHEDSFST